jgi:hypothetical protein
VQDALSARRTYRAIDANQKACCTWSGSKAGFQFPALSGSKWAKKCASNVDPNWTSEPPQAWTPECTEQENI